MYCKDQMVNCIFKVQFTTLRVCKALHKIHHHASSPSHFFVIQGNSKYDINHRLSHLESCPKSPMNFNLCAGSNTRAPRQCTQTITVPFNKVLYYLSSEQINSTVQGSGRVRRLSHADSAQC